jgi:hypothetical protein
MPSRSVLNTESPPDTSGAGTHHSSLPAGLSVAPAQPGISPLSGLPISDIPAVSRGTTPLGPASKPADASAPASAVESSAPAAPSRAPNVVDPTGIAAHPQTNPLIGMGTTTVVPTPPPAAHAEAVPAAPTNDLGQVWVAGHYSWVGGQWTWVDGTWQRPPNTDALWIPGNYDAQNKRWTEGHWDTTGSTRRER